MRLRNIPGAEEIIENSSRVIKHPEEYKGRWHELFENKNPIHIEIGMGKGQFITRLAQTNPHINYIGIERYSSVLLRAIEKLEENTLSNLYFLKMDAAEIENVFATEEVDKIYLNFSDPWPKDRHAKRRLTSQQFLDRYDMILNKNGFVEFKTDNKNLFEFSMETIQNSNWQLYQYTFDLHHDIELVKGNIMTEYEEKFSSIGNPIYKLICNRL